MEKLENDNLPTKFYFAETQRPLDSDLQIPFQNGSKQINSVSAQFRHDKQNNRNTQKLTKELRLHFSLHPEIGIRERREIEYYLPLLYRTLNMVSHALKTSAGTNMAILTGIVHGIFMKAIFEEISDYVVESKYNFTHTPSTENFFAKAEKYTTYIDDVFPLNPELKIAWQSRIQAFYRRNYNKMPQEINFFANGAFYKLITLWS